MAVGSVLAEIAPSNGGWQRRRPSPRPQSLEPEPAAPETPPSAGNGEVAAGPAALVDIVTPAGGESVQEGTILEWTVAVGDEVEEGQTVVELSTDKVDMELPAPVTGTIAEILAEAGETVSVGHVIARMRPGAISGNGASATRPPQTARRRAA